MAKVDRRLITSLKMAVKLGRAEYHEETELAMNRLNKYS